MKISIKNTGLFIFPALALMPLLVAVWFVVMSGIITHQMEERLENSLLTEIQIPANSVIWLKAGKEILANNEPFDIKSFQIKNGVYHFKGLYDKNEKALKIALSHQQHETGKNIFHLIFIGLYFQETDQQTAERSFIILRNNRSPQNDFRLSTYKEAKDHPPKQFS